MCGTLNLVKLKMGISPQAFVGLALFGVGLAAYLSLKGYRGNEYVLGIDLGTTYSVAAVKKGG